MPQSASARVVTLIGMTCVVALAVRLIRAQNPRDQAGAVAPGSEPGTAVVSGLVAIVGPPAAPVRRARVTLESDDGTRVTTDTDTAGRYRFDHVRAGSVRVRVDKPGFVPAGPPSRAFDPPSPLVIGPAASVTADVSMVRGAAIEGRLVNESGDPIANIAVSAMRSVYGPYGRRPVLVRQAVTDDRGHFRIHTLPAGEYYIAAAPPAQNPQRLPPGTGIARSYYPGTVRVDDARVVEVGAGEEATGIDFPLTIAPVVALSVRVVDAAGKAPANFGARLQPVGAPPGDVLGFSFPQDNQMQFPAVAPGDYYLLGVSQSSPAAPIEYAVSRVTIAGSDRQQLSLTTGPGTAVHGHVEVAEGGKLPPNLRVVPYETAFEFPGLRDVTSASDRAAGSVGSDGAVTFPSLAGPRLIRVEGLRDGWAVASVWLDGVDVTDTPVDFAVGAVPRTLRVVMTSRTGIVRGTVHNGDARAAGWARVVALADDPRQWFLHSRLVVAGETDADGRYVLRGLLPGRYRVIASDSLDDGAWNDPDVPARMANTGAAVTIAPDGGVVTLDLPLRGALR